MTPSGTDYDVIVVGAGPAGASASLCLARAGVKVLLLEKTDGSREKVCGGGLLRGAQRQLMRLGLWKQVDNNASMPSAARISSPDGSLAEIALPETDRDATGFVRITRRAKLDNALLQLACSAGAVLMNSTRAVAAQADARCSELIAEQRGRETKFTCQLVLAADGAANAFSRRMGIAYRSQTCPAVRAYLTCDDAAPHAVDFHFFARCLPLYCWVFPIESGLCNVGLAMPPSRNANLAAFLQYALEHEPLLKDRLRGYALASKVQGGILRTGLHPDDAIRDRLLAVGDAAALVSPLTGEGIKQALISGELAAVHALRALQTGSFTRQALLPYAVSLRSTFGTRNRQLAVLNALISIPGVMNRMVRLLKHDDATASLLRKTLADPGTWGPASLASLLTRIISAPRC